MNAKDTAAMLAINLSKPIAYAIFGIANGRHYVRAVKPIPANDANEEWKTDDHGLGEYWAGNEPLSISRVTTQREVVKSLTRCAASRDGDCSHVQCPQKRDNEPSSGARHCPLDNHNEED